MKYLSILLLTLVTSCSYERNFDETQDLFRLYIPDSVSLRPTNDYNKKQLLKWILTKTANKIINDTLLTLCYDTGLTKKAVNIHIEDNEIKGTYTYWHKNGTIWYQGYTVNGKDNGIIKEWRSGSLVKQWKEENDNIVGTVTEWNKNGKLYKEREFRKGIKVKTTKYDSIGNKKSELYFKQRLYYRRLKNLEYLEITYSQNGQIDQVFIYDRYIDSESLKEFMTKTDISCY